MPAAQAPKRLQATPAGMHGRGGQHGWAAPLVVRECAELARPGYNSKSATEYVDEPAVLLQKVRRLAALLRASKACACYTGAGISTASGIKDYASKAQGSVGSQPKASSPLLAEPTRTHRVLTALFQAGHLKHWCQQNHDGLPQKAGFPPEHLNEIHGSWFDPSNPVVPMSGTLRRDLCDELSAWAEQADLVLALGTSLCGMSADRLVAECARRSAQNRALGSVIVGLQQTAHDEDCQLRIFGRMDEVMQLLAEEMQLQVQDAPYAPSVPKPCRVAPHCFAVPYDADGKRTDGPGRLIWDLRQGQKVRVTAGPGKGFEGIVSGMDPNGHYRIALPKIREGDKLHGQGRVDYALGSWWAQAAAHGRCPQLPVVSVSPRVTTLEALRERGAAPEPKPKGKAKPR